MDGSQQQQKRIKGLRVATRCTTVEQFVAMFKRHCEAQSVFVPTPASRPVGLETAFSIDLADGKPALRGLGVVLEAWPTASNRFGRPGILLGIRRLTADGAKLWDQVLAARALDERAAAPIAPADASNTDINDAPAPEVRTPGSELVLPANPLSGIADESLGGFVDCTIFEETGSFFPVEPAPEDAEDPAAAPPLLAPLVRRPPTPVPVAPPAASERAEVSAVSVVELAPEDVIAEPATRPAMPPPAMPPPTMAQMPPPAMPPMMPAMPPMMPAPVPPLMTAIPHAMAPRSRTSWVSLVERAKQLVQRHRHRRGFVIALVAVPTVVLVLLIALLASSGGSHAAEPDPAPPAQVVHAAATQPPAAPAAPPAATAEAPPDEGAAAGTPAVGKGPCRVTVTSTPAGSVVAVDGEVAGPSPITIAGPCQRRQLAVSHPRYETNQRAIVLAAGKPESIDVTLQRPMHHLMIDTTPSGAVISIGGHRAGVSPTNVDIMGFTSLDITIAKPPFRPVTTRIYSKVASDHLSVKLSR